MHAHGWAAGVAVALAVVVSPTVAQVPGPPAGVKSCTETGSTQPRQALLGFANSLKVRDTTHEGGAHHANLTLSNPRRIGPEAIVWPVENINKLQYLSEGRAGTVVAKVWVDPSFTDPETGKKGYEPLNLPPGISDIMMCESGSNYSARIIPEDGNEPLRTRSVSFYPVSEQFPTARARFKAAHSETICLSCKLYGWCEIDD
jgi:hypothetical protein